MTLDDEFPELCMDDEFPETQPVVESDGESTSSYVNRCVSCNAELNCEEAQFCGGQGCLVEQQETPRDSIHASLATGELAVAKFFRGCPLARVAAFGADPIATAPEQEQEQPEQQGAEGEEQGQGYLRFLQEGGRPWGQEQEQHQPLERVPFVILEERARERRDMAAVAPGISFSARFPIHTEYWQGRSEEEVRSEIVREQESRGATGAEADHLEWTTVAIYHDFDLEQQEQRDEVMPTASTAVPASDVESGPEFVEIFGEAIPSTTLRRIHNWNLMAQESLDRMQQYEEEGKFDALMEEHAFFKVLMGRQRRRLRARLGSE
jgi:hypothetical protein